MKTRPYYLYVLLMIFAITGAIQARIKSDEAEKDSSAELLGKQPADGVKPLMIVPSKQNVEKYSYVFFDINLACSYTNPYNPDDISVDIVFKEPVDKQIVLPCFFVSGEPGKSKWQGRFTPQKTGRYSYQAKIFVKGVMESCSNVFHLTVEDSNKDGFLHLNPESYYFLRYDSGRPFRGIGQNICWDPRPNEDQKYKYEYMFPLMGASSCNFTRIWMCPWNMPLEWSHSGLGRYNEDAAARLDTVLSLAEQNGLYMMLALDFHGVFKSVKDPWGGGDYWMANPYNAVNGGPCSNQTAFFSNPDAKNIYKKRLRYIIARWGYNTHLGVIEFFNEVDHAYDDGDANVPASDIVSWHDEMSSYLKSIDPFGHLVSTSCSHKTLQGLWDLRGLDFSQTHLYGPTDKIYEKITSFINSYNKPYVTGEFAYTWENAGTSETHPAYRRELHMGMWRGMFSPTPILPMTWWWESFADDNDLAVFKAVSTFGNQMTSESGGSLSPFSVNAGESMETMALKSSDRIFVWLRNNTSATLSNSILTITDLQNGNYEVKYYNTWAGTYSKPDLINVTTGVLQSQIPSLTADKDIACYVLKINPGH